MERVGTALLRAYAHMRRHRTLPPSISREDLQLERDGYVGRAVPADSEAPVAAEEADVYRLDEDEDETGAADADGCDGGEDGAAETCTPLGRDEGVEGGDGLSASVLHGDDEDLPGSSHRRAGCAARTAASPEAAAIAQCEADAFTMLAAELQMSVADLQRVLAPVDEDYDYLLRTRRLLHYLRLFRLPEQTQRSQELSL